MLLRNEPIDEEIIQTETNLKHSCKTKFFWIIGETEDALPTKDSSGLINVKNANEDSLSKLQFSTYLVYDDHVMLPDAVSVSSLIFHLFFQVAVGRENHT